MKIIILIAVLIAWSFSLSHAQADLITDQEISRLDSLMFIGHSDEVSKFFILKDSLIHQEQYDQSRISKYDSLKSQYMMPIDYIATFSIQDTVAINRFISQFRKLSTLFNPTRVGHKASQSFEKFLSLAQINGRELEALKYYYIAYFFKIKHTHEALRKVRTSLALAQNYFFENKLTEASDIIQTIELGTYTNSLFAPVADSLRSLTNKIDRQISRQGQFEHLWHKKESSDYVLNFSIGNNVAYQKTTQNLDVAFVNKDNNEIKNVEINKISPDLVLSYYFMLQFQLRKNLYLGADFTFTRFSYSSENIQQPIFFDFNIKQYSSHLYAQYLFRTSVGIRPYMSFGAGSLHAKRDRSDAAILTSSELNEPPVPEFFEIPPRMMTSPQLLSICGLEYMASKKSKLILRSHIVLYYNFSDSDYISKSNFLFGLNVGVIL